MIELPEIAEQDLSATRDSFAIAEESLDLLPFDTALAVRQIAEVEQSQQAHDIGDAIGHPGVRREPITSGAPRLLIIGLKIFGCVEMGYEPDIRLVDPHPKSNRRDDHYAFFPDKAFLVTFACQGFKTSMVGKGRALAGCEPSGNLIDRTPCGTINDPGITRVFFGKEGPELFERVALREHSIEQVWPIVARSEDPGFC